MTSDPYWQYKVFCTFLAACMLVLVLVREWLRGRL